MQQFDQQMAEGRLGDAIVTTIKGSGTPKSWAWIPRALLAPFLSFGMRVEARRVKDDDVPLRDLLPTIHHEIELVKRTKGTLNDYRGIAANVLLLYGSHTDSVFKVTATALQSVLPHSICIELPDLDHRSVRTTANRDESLHFCKFSSTLLASSPLVPHADELSLMS